MTGYITSDGGYVTTTGCAQGGCASDGGYASLTGAADRGLVSRDGGHVTGDGGVGDALT